MIFLGKNRDRLSLMAAIVDAASCGVSKTRIMYMANLSYKLLEKYLDASINLGLVYVNGSVYELTAKGKDFLKRYQQYEDKYARIQRTLQCLADEREQLERFLGTDGD